MRKFNNMTDNFKEIDSLLADNGRLQKQIDENNRNIGNLLIGHINKLYNGKVLKLSNNSFGIIQRIGADDDEQIICINDGVYSITMVCLITSITPYGLEGLDEMTNPEIRNIQVAFNAHGEFISFFNMESFASDNEYADFCKRCQTIKARVDSNGRHIKPLDNVYIEYIVPDGIARLRTGYVIGYDDTDNMYTIRFSNEPNDFEKIEGKYLTVKGK